MDCAYRRRTVLARIRHYAGDRARVRPLLSAGLAADISAGGKRHSILCGAQTSRTSGSPSQLYPLWSANSCVAPRADCQHWSARSPKDTNATLWAGFHVRSHSPKPKSFIHLGDTGFSPTLFAAVGRVLGPIDLAAIPIGSYEPRWHMHLQHTDPEGAVRMAIQMGIKRAVGVHWGTWLMSDEACEFIH